MMTADGFIIDTKAALRAMLKKQGSYGAVGNGYAVVQKVDYSMSKGGGLKLWAVIFVFIILCSSLYMVFTTNGPHQGQLNVAIDLDGDGDLDDGADDFDDDAAVALEKERERKEHSTRSPDTPASVAKMASVVSGTTTAGDDEDDEEEELTPTDTAVDESEDADEDTSQLDAMEEMMLRKLKERSQQLDERRNSERDTPDTNEDDNDNDEETDDGVEEEPPAPPKAKSARTSAKSSAPKAAAASATAPRVLTVSRPKKTRDSRQQATRQCAGRGGVADCGDEDIDEDVDDEVVEAPSPSPVKRKKREKATPASEPTPPADKTTTIRVTRIKGKKKEDKSKRRDSHENDAEQTTTLAPPAPATTTEVRGRVKIQYKKTAITNRDDNRIRDRLDDADALLEQMNTQPALDAFNRILKDYPSSPRALYGKARALDKLAQRLQSNELLSDAIMVYQQVLDSVGVPEPLFRMAADRLVDRANFRGWMRMAMRTQRRLIDMFPEEIDLQNKFGVTFMMMNRYADAKKIFHNILEIDPLNGFALAHYGFILKVHENNMEEGVKLMRKGIRSNAPGTSDGRFYFHVGDGLQRMGRHAEAYKIYEEGAEKGLFLSKYQRSLYNVNSLKSRPWWTIEETGYAKQLRAIEKEWMAIADEATALFDKERGVFAAEDEQLTRGGDWRQLTFYQRGVRNNENCARAPKTCAIVEQFPDAIGCTRGQIKFSVMQGGTRVWPHCGPTNCRLRAHLGLVTPAEPRIRVANETRAWRQGRLMVFDDSFEHEVWHDGHDARLVLILDFWHPDLDARQKRNLSPI